MQLRDTNNRGILSALVSVGHKHTLRAQSTAEGPSSFKIGFKILKFDLKDANVINILIYLLKLCEDIPEVSTK